MTKARVFGAIMTGLVIGTFGDIFHINWLVAAAVAGLITYAQLTLDNV